MNSGYHFTLKPRHGSYQNVTGELVEHQLVRFHWTNGNVGALLSVSEVSSRKLFLFAISVKRLCCKSVEQSEFCGIGKVFQ